MTSSQFGGLVKRLVTFTSQNLRNLMSNMKLQSFFDNIDKLSVSESILKLSRRGEERGGEGRGGGRGGERRGE